MIYRPGSLLLLMSTTVLISVRKFVGFPRVVFVKHTLERKKVLACPLMQLTRQEFLQNYTFETGPDGNVTLSIPWQLFSDVKNNRTHAGTETANYSNSKAHSFSILTDARTPFYLGLPEDPSTWTLSDIEADPCAEVGATCSWPDVLGTDYKRAIAELRNATAKTCIPVPSGSVVVTNYNPNRIYVWYDPETGTVTRVPEAG
eukprot:jgi/Botrbrau1/6574/Bobra.0189s0002.2